MASRLLGLGLGLAGVICSAVAIYLVAGLALHRPDLLHIDAVTASQLTADYSADPFGAPLLPPLDPAIVEEASGDDLALAQPRGQAAPPDSAPEATPENTPEPAPSPATRQTRTPAPDDTETPEPEPTSTREPELTPTPEPTIDICKVFPSACYTATPKPTVDICDVFPSSCYTPRPQPTPTPTINICNVFPIVCSTKTPLPITN
jgi:hypothetical protein